MAINWGDDMTSSLVYASLCGRPFLVSGPRASKASMLAMAPPNTEASSAQLALPPLTPQATQPQHAATPGPPTHPPIRIPRRCGRIQAIWVDAKDFFHLRSQKKTQRTRSVYHLPPIALPSRRAASRSGFEHLCALAPLKKNRFPQTQLQDPPT